MYRKITHNIVEEHFDHPMANDIKSNVEKGKSVVSTKIFDKQDFDNQVDTWVKNYTDTIISMLNNINDQEIYVEKFESIFPMVDKMGNTANEFYPAELGERLNLVFRRIPVSLYALGIAGMYGRTDRWADSRLNAIAVDISNIMQNYDPAGWSVNIVRPLFEPLPMYLSEYINAYVQKDNVKMEDAESKIRIVLKSFANIFKGGLQRKFPNRFIEQTTFDSKVYSIPESELM